MVKEPSHSSSTQSRSRIEAELSAFDLERGTFEIKSEWTKPPRGTESFVGNGEVATCCVKNMIDSVKDTSRPNHVAQRQTSLRTSVRGALSRVPPSMILDPSAPKRIIWDLSGMFLIGYDMISIPVHLCFAEELGPFSVFMGWITLLFWTLDMVASVFTGFYVRGHLDMNQRNIVMNYLKGWFWLDCIVVLPDWVFKAMGDTTNAVGLGRVLRIARIMRVLRLLRLLKLKRIFDIFYDLIDSEGTFIVFKLVKLLAMMMIMNHTIACLWYLVGTLSMENGAPLNWLQNVGLTKVYDQSLTWKYLTSLHWSITQFTPASMDVYATNVPERVFSIVILFWALGAVSSIIGSVSASMTALRDMSANENRNFWVLRRYLRQENVGRALIGRILNYLEDQQMKKHGVVAPGSVVLLGQLSLQFQEELAHELNSPFLIEHPLFTHMADDPTMKKTMYRMCHKALITIACATEEGLFSAGDQAHLMYFVKTGSFDYKLVDGTVLAIPLGPKMWVGEAVLWTTWRHRGWMTAQTPSEAFALVPAKFSEICQQHPKPWYLAMHYAVAFVDYMNKAEVGALTDVIFDVDVWKESIRKSDTFQLGDGPFNWVAKPFSSVAATIGI